MSKIYNMELENFVFYYIYYLYVWILTRVIFELFISLLSLPSSTVYYHLS